MPTTKDGYMTRKRSDDEAKFERNLLQRGILRATYIVRNYSRDDAITVGFIEAMFQEGFNGPVSDVEWALNRIATLAHNTLVELPNRKRLPSKADLADAIHQRVGLTDILK
jgi:hypothetical protein